VLRYLEPRLLPTLDDLAWLMIVLSDNIATHALIRTAPVRVYGKAGCGACECVDAGLFEIDLPRVAKVASKVENIGRL
jgi:hypothetical protein